MAAGEQKDVSYTLGTYGINCPICLEIYKEPRALACLHTFCLQCINTHILNSKEKVIQNNGIECPICRTITRTVKTDLSPEDWTQELPSNCAVIESLNTDSVAESKPYCQPCLTHADNNKASFFCPSCNEYQCETCVGIHAKYGFMKEHKLIDLDKRDVTSFDFKHFRYCHEHGKLIKFYCSYHRHLCCKTCAIKEHKRCVKIELRDVDKRIVCKGVKQHMSRMIKAVHRLCAALAENERAIELDIVQIDGRLKDIRQKVLTRLDHFEKEIRRDVHIKQRSVKLEVDEKRNKSNRLIAALEGSIGIVDFVVQKRSHEDQFVTIEKLKQQCQRYAASTNELFDAAKEVRIDLNVDERLTRFNDSTDKLGMVNVVSKTMRPYKTSNMKPLQVVELEGTDRQTPLLTGVGFLSDRMIVTVDYTNDECLIMNNRLEHLSCCKLPFKPQGLTILTTDEVLITGETAIHSFIVDAENDLKPQNTMLLPVNVCSISEIDTDTFVVGCFDTNVPVCKVTRQGKVTRFVGDFPDVTYNFNDSLCCFSKTNNILVVTFCKQNEIRIVDTKYETTTVVKNLTLIRDPRNVVSAGGISGSIYVCSCDTNSIVQISLDGLILRSHKLTDMQFPYMIAISDTNDILVASNSKESKRVVMSFALTRGI